MRRTIKTLVPLGLAGIMMSLGLTSCTPPAKLPNANAVQPSNGSTSRETPSIPLIWADGSRVSATAHSVEQARVAGAGPDFTEESSTRTISGGRMVFEVEGMEMSGALVGAYGPRQPEKKLEETGQVIDPAAKQFGRYSGGAFEPFTIEGNPQKKHRAQEIAGTTMTDSGAVWVELYPEDAKVSGWEILGVAPGATEVRVLATSSWKADPDRHPDMKIIQPPVLIDGRVYWSVEYWNPAEDLSEYKLLSVDLENPMQVREEVGPKGTEQPASTGALYAWGGKIVNTADVPDDGKAGTLQAISAYQPGGQREDVLRLEGSSAAESVMRLMGADVRGFAVNHDEDLYLIDPNTRQAEVFPAPDDAEIAELNQCGPRIAWSYDSDSDSPFVQRYVYNRDTRDLSVLTTAASLGMVYCAGAYMSWPATDANDPKAEAWDVVTRWND